MQLACVLEDDVRAWIIEDYMKHNDITQSWLRLYRRLLIALARMYSKSRDDGDDETAAAIRNRMRPHLTGMWAYVDERLGSLSPDQSMTRFLIWTNAFDVTCTLWHEADVHDIAWDMFYKHGIVVMITARTESITYMTHKIAHSKNLAAILCAYRRYYESRAMLGYRWELVIAAARISPVSV